jgi:F-type H+-transporting ATPase subunit a
MHVDLNITQAVKMVWLAAGLTVIVLVVGARLIARSVVTTGRFANLVEAMVDFVRTDIVEAFLGQHAKPWFGFFAAIFFFILFANLLGKIPIPGFASPTGNINVTAALAIMVFVVAQTVGLFKLGLLGYFKKKFLLPGAPLVLKLLAIPIMVLVLFAEPFSLAVRLFANMFAGHMVLMTFATAQMVGGVWLLQHPNVFANAAATLPFALSVLLLIFELFIAFIQAFIFALLSALYLSESLEEHH